MNCSNFVVHLMVVLIAAYRMPQMMNDKTQAIVLTLSKYKDNACVLQAYTAESGRMAYMVYGNKYRGMLTPLSLVEITSSRRNGNPAGKGMAVLGSASLIYTPQRIPMDIKRQCVAMFIAEILSKTLWHPMQDQELFQWLGNVVHELDEAENVENLHLRFLIGYTMFLGIGIDETEHTIWFEAPRGRKERQQHLREICAYYEEHIEDFTSPKSLDVLMEVFD